MQGLVHYSDDSDSDVVIGRGGGSAHTKSIPIQRAAEAEEEKGIQVTTSSIRNNSSTPLGGKLNTPIGGQQQQRKTVTGVRRNTAARPTFPGEGLSQRAAPSTMTSPPPRLASATPALAFGNNNNDRSMSHTPVTGATTVPSLSISVPPSASAENHLTQNPPPASQPATTASSTSKPFTHAILPPPSDLDPWDTAYQHDFAGLSDDAVFKAITRPPPLVPGGLEGEDEWGIPEAVGGAGCSASLQAKVSNFLKMKVEQDRHINTTLLASTAFTNPHIYTKLVEFVDIDERGSAFPGGGWLTRRGLESRIPEWGAKALSGQQKAQETVLLASQSTGKRKTIDFTSSVSAGSGSGRSSKRRDPPPNRAGKYPQTSSSSAVVPRHLSAEAAESQIRAGERERSKRDSRSAGGDAVPSSGSRRRERPDDGAGVPGYSVNTGEGVSRRYERDRQEERDGGKRSLRGRRWD